MGGGLLVTLLAGRRRAVGRDLDLAAAAWVPVLAVEAALTLATQAFGLPLARRAQGWIWTGAVAWMGGLLVLAVIVARGRRAAPEVRP